MSAPLLSIVIPVYNVEAYLPECLDSVLSGGEYAGEYEIILVNDGSTDGSPAICRAYAAEHPCIKVVDQPNQGLSEARNTGIRHASGRYILFLDSDDFICRDCMEYIMSALADRRQDIFFGRAYKYYGDSEEYRPGQVDYAVVAGMQPAEAFLRLLEDDKFWFAAWLVIIDRQFLLANELFFMKGIYHEDELWVPSVFMSASSVGFLNKCFYGYRLNRAGSIVSKPNIKRMFDKVTVGEKLGGFSGRDSECDEIVRHRRASLLLGVILELSGYADNPDYRKLKKAVASRLGWLKYGKYRAVWLASKLTGVGNLSRLFSKMRH